jgi:pimeloyl-ACP methyl ester carboxylesterase
MAVRRHLVALLAAAVCFSAYAMWAAAQRGSTGQPSAELLVDATGVSLPPLAPLGDTALDGCRLRTAQHDAASYVRLDPLGAPPTGVLVLLHGCSHSAADFCPASAACPKCKGLPSEVTYVREGLRRGLTVVAVTSRDRVSGCWHGVRDVDRVRHVLEEEQLTSLPFVAMGASSGGSFAMLFAARFHNSSRPCLGVIAQVASPRAEKALLRTGETRFVWSVMSRDGHTAHAAELAARRGPTKGTACVVHHEPHQLTDDYFSRMSVSTNVTVDVSRAIVHTLREHRLLTVDGRLMADPRHSHWRVPVKRALAAFPDVRDPLVPDKSPIGELMNVAYGRHEFTGERSGEMLDFVLRKANVCPS